MSEEDEPLQVRSATIDRPAFVCPHCGAMAQQRWFTTFARAMAEGAAPGSPTDEKITELRNLHKGDTDFLAYLDARASLTPQLMEDDSGGQKLSVPNVFLSRCIVCTEKSIWLRDRVIWPARSAKVRPNSDLPPDIKRDFEEAAAIAEASPRSAAALLRLAIEKICRHLGKTGKIDTMIAALVADGLSVKIQQALDIVRVVGNESVHPGEMNVRDDAGTVSTLFELVNIIAETMISEPKRIEAVFSSLPAKKLEGIRNRDGK